MPPSNAATSSNTWLLLALMTVCFWGLYGIFIHTGVMAFNPKSDPNARYKAFLFVGLAYFLTAVLAPLAILIATKADWAFLTNTRGVTWSLIAGVVGAAGAFCVLLAFAKAGDPKMVPVIMSIIFAGAPIVNAVVALAWHPPKSGLGSIHPVFYLGIILAASGGLLVTLFKPS